jgi:hypothetical protein
VISYIYNPNYLGSEDKRITVRGQLNKMLANPASKNKPGMMEHTCKPKYVGSRDREIVVQGQSEQRQNTLSEKK